MKRAATDAIKSLAFLADDKDLRLAMLFGSGATGKSRFDSDIDVAIYPRATMDCVRRQRITDEIAVATGRAVDLIDLSTAGGSLLRQILHSGIVVFSKDPGILGSLTARMLDWQEDFEPQLNQLLDTRMRRFTASTHGS